jgi:GTPase-activating protein SAC7
MPHDISPAKDRTISLFQRSPTAESDKRQPNKLKKKQRVTSSSNPSAQSSANSLHGPSGAGSPGIPATQPSQDVAEYAPLASIPSEGAAGAACETSDPSRLLAEPTRPAEPHRSSDSKLKPQASSQSLHSREESMNEQSDIDPTDDPIIAAEHKEKRRRWRLSRRKEDTLGANLTSPKKSIGANGGADTSTTSFQSGRIRKSSTGDSVPVGSDSGMGSAHQQTSNDSGPSFESGGREREEKRGPIDWLKRKMQAKEEKRERDAEKEKERVAKEGHSEQPRGPSADIRRSAERTEEASTATTAAPA